MTGGLLDYVFETAQLQQGTDLSFDDALEMVMAVYSHEIRSEPETIGNVIYVDFRPRRMTDAVA